MLKVPRRLSRNAGPVRALGDPADTGLALIGYMCERIGIDGLGESDVLDLGCGVRFSQAILNRGAPIRSYTGLEVDRRVVKFLRKRVTDPRFMYHHVDVRNRRYNPRGRPLEPDAPSPLGERRFDIACMFSVITHQRPDEAGPTFSFLRRHIDESGHLFFSAIVHDDHEPYRELSPLRPGLRSSYSRAHLERLLDEAGWSTIDVIGPRPRGLPIQTSVLCRPAPT